MSISFLTRQLSPEDAAHCRLKAGRDEAIADFAFDEDDDLLEARNADPIADVGKSGRTAVAICGKSAWPETDGGVASSILLAIFKEPIAHAVSVHAGVQVTFGEQHAKLLSRLLAFVERGAMKDTPMPIMEQVEAIFRENFDARSPAQHSMTQHLGDTKLREWVSAGRAYINLREDAGPKRSRAAYDVSDDELYCTLSLLETAMQPDVLKHFFDVACCNTNMGVNTLFNGAKGFMGVLQLLRATVQGEGSRFGAITVFGGPEAYIKESFRILQGFASKHGRQRRKKEKESKSERETGYYLANISDARRMVGALLSDDLDDFATQTQKAIDNRRDVEGGLMRPAMDPITAGHLRGALVVAIQTTSPPLRIGAYINLTQVATLRALVTWVGERRKRRKLAEEQGRDPEKEDENVCVYLPVGDKTSKEWGKAGIKIDRKLFDQLLFWLMYGRPSLSDTVRRTSIPCDSARSRRGIIEWCNGREKEPDYSSSSDTLFPTINGHVCHGLGALTKPIYNHYINLELNTTSVRR